MHEARVIAWCPYQRKGLAHPKHVQGSYHLVERAPGGEWDIFTACGLSIAFLSRADARKWRFAPEGQDATCTKCIAKRAALAVEVPHV